MNARSVSLALPLGVFLASAAHATPSYALRTGATCTDCHADGAGGGLLTPRGAAFAHAALPTFGAVEGHARRAHRPDTLDAGFDLRAASSFPLGGDVSAELAHADLHLAARPYNPPGDAEGRLAVLVTGDVAQNAKSRFMLRTYGLVLDDLLFGASVRAGRFAPELTVSERSDGQGLAAAEFDLYGAPNDRRRTTLGLFMGLSPGPVSLTLELFNPGTGAYVPFDADAGLVTAMGATWHRRGLRLGLAGASASAVSAPAADGQSVAGRWGLDLAPLAGVPISYRGEYRLRRGHTGRGAETGTGLAAAHTLAVSPTRGVDAEATYEWQDPDIDLRYDSRHRARLGAEWRFFDGFACVAEYSHAWQYAGQRFSSDADAVTLTLRAWR